MEAELPRADCTISTRGLSFAYGKTTVLTDLSLSVPQRKIYGFLGRNGSGKTTTIRLLMGMMKAQAGDIQIGDFIGQKVPAQARLNIGFVAQSPRFYDWMTGMQLSRFLGQIYPTWDQTHFERVADRLQVDIKKRVDALSLGTLTKLAVALGVGHKPPLLLLDEPTAGVDPGARSDLLNIVRMLVSKGDCSVFFSTHYIRDVEEVGDWVGMLHNGRLIYEGPVNAVAQWWHDAQGGDEGLSLEEVFLTATGGGL